MAKSSKDFSQGRDEWEMAVFREASMFTVVHHLGRKVGGPPEFERWEFKPDEFPVAVQASTEPTSNGKPRLLYAVTAEGRQSCLDKADHEKWLNIWRGMQK